MSRNRVARAQTDCAPNTGGVKKKVPKGTLWLTGKLHSFGHPSTKFRQNQKLRIMKTAPVRAPFRFG
jgi:hypothetical protein